MAEGATCCVRNPCLQITDVLTAIRSTERTDTQGTKHIMMHFHVDGPTNNGIAQLHMAKRRDQSDFEYKYLFVDVKGHERIYLENAETSAASKAKKQLSLFGVKW